MRYARSEAVRARRAAGGGLRGAIVMTEVALTCILLAGAGLIAAQRGSH